MFGIIYLLGSLIKSTISDLKDQHENNQCRQRNIVDDKGLTYIDNKGRHLFRSNDHGVWTKVNKTTGAVEYVDMKTQKVVATFPNTREIEALEKRIEDTRKSGKRTVCILKTDGWRTYYIDVYTRDEYVIRKIRQRYYYINTHTGLIVRETDMSKLFIHKGDGILPEEMNRHINVREPRTAGFPEVSYDWISGEFYS